MKIDRIKEKLKKIMSDKRYMHTIRVCCEAGKLAKYYGVDVEKARKAALLHDCAKEFAIKDMKRLLKNSEVLEIGSEQPAILHGYAGAIYARNIFKIEDKEILNAIRHHTTGSKKMSMLEKVIYLADIIEPNRKGKNIEKIREKAYGDMDEAILIEVEDKINFLMKKGRPIHASTLELRNTILLKREKIR